MGGHSLNIRHLSVRLLQVFLVVAQTGSVTRAAERLHLTQPTVSLQIRRLAEELGEPLFERQADGLRLTEAGALLYAAANDVLDRLERMGDELDALRGGLTGRLSISAVTTAKYLLPTLIGRFAKAFPEVDVTLHIGNRSEILRRYTECQDQLYVFSQPPTTGDVVACRFMPNPLVLIAPADHPAVGRSVRFEELRHERFILREPGSGTRMTIEHWLFEQGLTLVRTQQIESNEAIRLAVAAGLGLAVLSHHTLLDHRAPIAVLDIPGFPIKSDWFLVGHGDRPLGHGAASFLRFLDGILDQDPVWREPLQKDLGPLLRLALPPA